MPGNGKAGGDIEIMLLDKMLLIYYEMQRHSATKKLVVFLQKHNFVHKIKYMMGWGYVKDKKERKNPTEGMKESQSFFQMNRQRIDKVMELMADDMSRDVYMAVWAYRMYRTSIRKKFYSEKNQYLLDGILTLENNEIFVDGGVM